ncbi:hypothetical protein ACUNI6_22565 [Serratia sp. IR-2025]
MMHQINERADYSAEFWSLIHLESELMAARAWMNVFGSLPEGQGTRFTCVTTASFLSMASR